MEGFRIVGLLFLFTMACANHPKIIDSKVVENSRHVIETPYVLVISLDGFRWDYVGRFNPPHLKEFINNGASVKSLIPVYPSKTFPNHYSIATGMYPDNHHILGNSYFNYSLNEFYSIDNRESVESGKFYGGKPIWVHAAISGMITASYYFLGSEAEIQGIRPTYFYRFEKNTENRVKVRQVLNWLKLPEAKRPHLITMYFSDMDDIGHKVGPNNDQELKQALFQLDADLGELFNGIKASGLAVNTLIVSDHGMMEISLDHYLSKLLISDENQYFMINNGSMVSIHPKRAKNVDIIYEQLVNKSKGQPFKVYMTEDTPGFKQKPVNKNWGPIQVIPDLGYYFSSENQMETKQLSGKTVFGQHGFDPINTDMHGIFYAQGPAFKNSYSRASVENIHIFPLICYILGLEIPDSIDGQLSEIVDVLKKF